MMIYYQMTYCDEDDYKPYGIAYAPENVDAFLLPESGQKIMHWEPISLELKEGGYSDYLSNDLGGRLCSKNLKELINTLKTEEDTIQWLEVDVHLRGEQSKKYYFLHFPTNIPVVNKKESLIVEDMVVKVVLNSSVVAPHTLFTLPDSTGRALFISNKLKLAIEEKALSGMSFSKSRVV